MLAWLGHHPWPVMIYFDATSLLRHGACTSMTKMTQGGKMTVPGTSGTYLYVGGLGLTAGAAKKGTWGKSTAVARVQLLTGSFAQPSISKYL